MKFDFDRVLLKRRCLAIAYGDQTVFIVYFGLIWNVSHSLHTPLMAITNAISSIIILGAILQIGSSSLLVTVLAGISVFFAGINIFGGFLVTRRMLAMFQKS